jgi:hypothetical protein
VAGGSGGYSSVGAGGAAGNGSSTLTVSNTTVNSLGGYVGANGGNGGDAAGTSSGAVGGTATASVSTSGAFRDYASGQATGGTGGRTFGTGTGGVGGAAASTATATSTTKGTYNVAAYTRVSGGQGGGNNDAGNGGAGGAATGSSATATESGATGGRALADARSYGGTGGRATGAGSVGGAGSAASGTAATASGFNAVVRAYQTGGSGGRGYSGASGGAGASSTLTNAVSGTTTGGYLTFHQGTAGGNGGYGTAAAGSGGTGTSSLTFDDVTQNAIQASSLRAYIGGQGGNGGGGSTGSTGGAGTATLNLTGASNVDGIATGTGGGGQGSSAVGGAGTATATVTATIGTATAAATAIGGSGSTEAAANATSTAITTAGQQAEATSTGTGGSGLATATATTSGTGIATGISSIAQDPVTTVASEAQSFANSVNPYGYAGSSIESYASGTLAPNSSFVSNVFAANSKIAATSSPGNITGLGGSNAAVFGAGVEGMNNPASETGSHTYTESQDFTLNGSIISGHLIVGLDGYQVAGSTGDTSDFSNLTFTVTVGGVTKVNDSFTSLSAAEAFFSNDAVDAGTFSSTANLAVDVSLSVTTSTAGFDFGQSFVLGSTDGYAPPVVTAPSSVVDGQGKPAAIPGVSVSEATPLTAGQTVTVNLSDTHGLLSETAAQGTITGSGTTSLTLTGTVAQVNADLATLKVTDSTLPSDTITVTSSDSRTGDGAPVTIGVSVNTPPSIAAPSSATVTEGTATPITGVSLAETGNTTGETFTATLSDANGLLSATGTGVSGSGTTMLTITGSLSQVNADLATLQDTDSTLPSDTITIKASDSLGNSATNATIAVTVSSSGGQTFTFTTGVDHFVGGSANDTFVAASKTLSKGDTADGGGGTNTLELMGGGTFDLADPTTLTNILLVTATEGAGSAKPTITLRNGLNVTLDLASGTGGSAGATIKGANDSSIINLGSGKDTVTVGSANETINGGSGEDTIEVNASTIDAKINGGTNAKTVLELTVGGTVTMGAAITDIPTVELKKAANFTANAESGLTIKGSKSADTLTAGGSGQTLTGNGGADTLVGSTAGGDTFEDTYTNLNGVTIDNFAASGDAIDITNLSSKGATESFSNGKLTVVNGTKSVTINLAGTFTTADFHLSADGSGTKITQSGGSDAAVQALVQAMASFAPDVPVAASPGGQSLDPLTPLLAAAHAH